MTGFKKFILRGNVVDLAVAVVLGAAFVAVVTSVVKGLITPLIGLIVGARDFSALTFTVNSSTFLVGDIINAIVSFVLIAAVVYFLIVLPTNAMLDRMKPAEPAAPATRECPECLSKIPVQASRCAFCTSPVTPPSP